MKQCNPIWRGQSSSQITLETVLLSTGLVIVILGPWTKLQDGASESPHDLSPPHQDLPSAVFPPEPSQAQARCSPQTRCQGSRHAYAAAEEVFFAPTGSAGLFVVVELC